ncbi:MAG: hypothetical protein ACHQT7_03105 [Candidatus Levyibacteriota bacterium]
MIEKSFTFQPDSERREKIRSTSLFILVSDKRYTHITVEYLRDKDPEPHMKAWFEKYGPYWTVHSASSIYNQGESTTPNPQTALWDLKTTNTHAFDSVQDALSRALAQELTPEQNESIQRMKAEIEGMLVKKQSG